MKAVERGGGAGTQEEGSCQPLAAIILGLRVLGIESFLVDHVALAMTYTSKYQQTSCG